jgi:hypothetical protein
MIARPGTLALRLIALLLVSAPALAATQLTASPLQIDFGNVGVGTLSAPEPITVNNESGSDNLTITVAALTGPDASQFAIAAPSLPKTMLPSENMILTLVTYQPTATGQHTASLVISSSAGAATIALTGTGVDAKIEVTPMAIDFGTKQVGEASDTTTIHVYNHGQFALTLMSVGLDGPDQTSFALVSPPPSGSNLDAGGELTFDALCTPTVDHVLLADILITSSDTETPSLRVHLSCTGVVGGVSLVPPAVDFGQVISGGAGASLQVTVTNTSSAAGVDVTVDGVDLVPSPPTSPFGVVAPTGPIGFGQHQAINFTFQPATADEGAFDATAIVHLTVGTLTSDVQVPLHGIGVLPHATVSTTTLVFDDQRVGTQGQQDLVVRNTGGAALTVSQLTALDPPFSLLTAPSLPVHLGPNEALTLTVGFTPTDVGPAAGSLGITTDDPNNNVINVDLQGHGIAPHLLAAPMQVDFGQVRRTTSGAPQTVTLTNAGTDVLSISKIKLAGEGANAFAVTGLTAPLTIDAQQDQTLTVTFTPPVATDYSATITITTDDPAGADTVVNLTGSGVAPSLEITPADEYSFPDTYVGKQTQPVTFTVHNTDTGPLALGSLALQAGATDFTLDAGTYAGTLGTGESVTFTVVFAPTAVGTKTATIDLMLAGDTTPAATLTVHGTGATSSTSGGCAAGGGGGLAAPLGLALALALALARRRRRA